jgi:hypothetical protein
MTSRHVPFHDTNYEDTKLTITTIRAFEESIV